MVETPTWLEVNRAELFLTRTYADPVADAEQNGEPQPDRVAALAPVRLERVNGGAVRSLWPGKRIAKVGHIASRQPSGWPT